MTVRIHCTCIINWKAQYAIGIRNCNYTITTVVQINLLQESDDDDVANTGHWTPLGKTRLGSASLQTTATQAFNLPVSVPVTAKNVLLFVDVQVGTSNPERISHVKLYTTHKGVQYAKYISVHTYSQGAWSTNSDNIWLPLFTSRTVYVKSPGTHFGNSFCTIDIIGYR